MLIDGKIEENISCPFCKFRHPQRLSCETARHYAATAARPHTPVSYPVRITNDRWKAAAIEEGHDGTHGGCALCELVRV